MAGHCPFRATPLVWCLNPPSSLSAAPPFWNLAAGGGPLCRARAIAVPARHPPLQGLISPMLTQKRTWLCHTSGLETERGRHASLTLSDIVWVEGGGEKSLTTQPPRHNPPYWPGVFTRPTSRVWRGLLECKFGDWPEALKS